MTYAYRWRRRSWSRDKASVLWGRTERRAATGRVRRRSTCVVLNIAHRAGAARPRSSRDCRDLRARTDLPAFYRSAQKSSESPGHRPPSYRWRWMTPTDSIPIPLYTHHGHRDNCTHMSQYCRLSARGRNNYYPLYIRIDLTRLRNNQRCYAAAPIVWALCNDSRCLSVCLSCAWPKSRTEGRSKLKIGRKEDPWARGQMVKDQGHQADYCRDRKSAMSSERVDLLSY